MAQRSAHERLASRANRVVAFGQRRIALERHRLDKIEAKLDLLQPRRVLERGYSWLIDRHGATLTRADQFVAGQKVRAVLVDGEVTLQVEPRDLQG